MSMPSDEITPGELRRWLARIDNTLQNLVSFDKHNALDRRVADLEEGRKSLTRTVTLAIVGIVVTAIYAAFQLKGITP